MDAGEGYGLQGVVNGTFIYGTVICVIHKTLSTVLKPLIIPFCCVEDWSLRWSLESATASAK